MTADLASKEQVGKVVQRITSREEEGGLGLKIDILVNCGGIQRRSVFRRAFGQWKVLVSRNLQASC